MQDAWVAFHDNKEKVQKYLKPMLIGEVRQEDRKEVDFKQYFIDVGPLFKQPEHSVMVWWVIGSILHGGPIELYLVPASDPRLV